ISEKQLNEAVAKADVCRATFESEKKKLEEKPALREEPLWYVPATRAWLTMNWHLGVVRRHEQQKTNPMLAAEVHVVRLGEIAFATNPFEYYLDFGIQIKVRSPFVQTFLVQLA